MTAWLLVLALAAGAQKGPPGDGEIRTDRDAFTGDTITTLTLVLKGPKAPLPINLVFRYVRQARPKPGQAPEYFIDIHMQLYTGPIDPKAPHLLFVADKDLKEERSTLVNIDPKIPLTGELRTITAPATAATVTDLARARTIQGRVLGIAFVLTPAQVKALGDFSARLR